jgi:hypothetical protein
METTLPTTEYHPIPSQIIPKNPTQIQFGTSYLFLEESKRERKGENRQTEGALIDSSSDKIVAYLSIYT